MKLLLTNDDGIDAPGLQALFEAAVAARRPGAGRSHGDPVRL